MPHSRTTSYLLLALTVLSLTGDASADSPGLSFRYEPGDAEGGLKVYEGDLPQASGSMYIYGTITMGPVNPLNFVNDMPEWRTAPADAKAAPLSDQAKQDAALGGFVVQEQKPLPGHPQFLETIALGQKTGEQFVPVVRFGLANDRRGKDKDMAHVTCWISDGSIDYFAPFARPNTPYDFKIHLDTSQKRMSAWISGRGDDDWFMIAENVPVQTEGTAINHARIEMYPGGPEISNLRVDKKPWAEGEEVRPHPLAKGDRVVAQDKGFTMQAMCSTWRKPGKHVTIFRKQGVHAGFPDVALAGTNHLVCAWRASSHTGGNGPGLWIAHSYDLGKTWSEPKVETSMGGNCVRLQRLKDGTLVLLIDRRSGGKDQFDASWDLVLWDSTDEGKTWTNERWLRAKEVGGGGCIVPSRICEMDDGSWLLAASYFAKPKGIQWVENLDYYRSTDRGKTWEFVGAPSHYPPHSLSEPSPVQLADGTLVVYGRESRLDGMPGAKGYSTDGGKTWKYQELPHPITGRTCAGLLESGHVMNTFRSGVGRGALRAWIGDPKDDTLSQAAGGHYNDTRSIGMKDGAFHLDNDGMRGQFTKYTFRPADSVGSTVDLTFEVKVVENHGRAATVSIPSAGRFRIFPDHAVFAHNPSLRIDVTPGQFHTYRAVSTGVAYKPGNLRIYVDGRLALETDKGDGDIYQLPFVNASSYSLEFGNEASGIGTAIGSHVMMTWPDVYPANITPEVTGYSIWKRFEAAIDDPQAGKRTLSWVASRDGFPDQHQLDHMLEIDASANGHEQGYSGWTQLPDGRIFVVHYTDDTSAASSPNGVMFGVPWIRGTFLEPSDLPPSGSERTQP